MNQKQAIQNVLDTFETPRGKVEFVCNWLEDINWHSENRMFYETFSPKFKAWNDTVNNQTMEYEIKRAEKLIYGVTAIFGYGIDTTAWKSEGSGKEFVNELIEMLKI